MADSATQKESHQIWGHRSSVGPLWAGVADSVPPFSASPQSHGPVFVCVHCLAFCVDILHLTSLFVNDCLASRDRIAAQLSVFTSKVKLLISTPGGVGRKSPSPNSKPPLRLTIFMSRTNVKLCPRRKWDGVLVPVSHTRGTAAINYFIFY
jgi:hypothetical protein